MSFNLRKIDTVSLCIIPVWKNSPTPPTIVDGKKICRQKHPSAASAAKDTAASATKCKQCQVGT